MFALKEIELHWSEELEQKAQQEGYVDGQVDLLLRQLRAKFGDLPRKFIEQLEGIEDTAILERMSLQILTATSLDEIELP